MCSLRDLENDTEHRFSRPVLVVNTAVGEGKDPVLWSHCRLAVNNLSCFAGSPCIHSLRSLSELFNRRPQSFSPALPFMQQFPKVTKTAKQ